MKAAMRVEATHTVNREGKKEKEKRKKDKIREKAT